MVIQSDQFHWWWLASGKWDDCWFELIVSLGRCRLASSTVQWWQPMASCTPLAMGITVVLVTGPQLTRRFQSVSWAWSTTRSAMWVYQSVFLLWHETKKTRGIRNAVHLCTVLLGTKNEDWKPCIKGMCFVMLRRFLPVERKLLWWYICDTCQISCWVCSFVTVGKQLKKWSCSKYPLHYH